MLHARRQHSSGQRKANMPVAPEIVRSAARASSNKIACSLDMTCQSAVADRFLLHLVHYQWANKYVAYCTGTSRRVESYRCVIITRLLGYRISENLHGSATKSFSSRLQRGNVTRHQPSTSACLPRFPVPASGMFGILVCTVPGTLAFRLPLEETAPSFPAEQKNESH